MEAYAPLEPGDPERIGRYRIVGRLGAGGMGRVYLASSQAGRMLAVKVVRDEVAGDPGFRRRFAREVEAARRVTGPFTAAVVDADPEGEPPWLATEYVPGMSLKAAVEAHGALPEGTVLALAAGLAEALEGVHGAGIVHRDLKPSNVLLAADGPRVIDFGIAVAFEGTRLTLTGAFVGTPGFMSPEQLRGAAVGPASDVFALGALLAYAATGAGPFGGGSVHALNYRVVHEPPNLTGVAPGLANVVARCLAKEPGQRPTVARLVEELGQARGAGGPPMPTPPWSIPTAADSTAVDSTGVDSTGADPTAGDPRPAPAPTVGATAALPSPGTPGGGNRPLTRGPVLAGLAAVSVLAVVAATLLLVGGGGDPSGGAASQSPTPRPLVLRQLWSYEGDPSWPPMVQDGTVYLADGDGVVHAVDAATGDRRWQADRAWGAGASMVLADDVMYVNGYTDSSRDDETSRVFALEAGSGRRLWEYEPHRMLFGLEQSGKQLYFYGRRGSGYVSTVYALNTGTGKRAWSHATDIVWALTAADDVVYYVANGRKEKSPQLHALNAETGERLWKAPFAEDVYKRPESLTVADGVLYAIGADGTLSARRPDRGDLLWSHPAELRDFSDSETPVLSGGVVYYGGNDDTQGSKGQVLAVDAATGKRLWSYDTSPLSSPPAVASGTVYVSTKAGELHLLNARDGGFQGKAELADDADPTATVSDGKVYFGAGDGRLRAAAVTR